MDLSHSSGCLNEQVDMDILAAGSDCEALQDLQIRGAKNKQRSCSSRSGPQNKLSISHALQIKVAEYWPKLGDTDEALRELPRLPRITWKHPSTVKVRVAAIRELRENNQTAISA